MNELEEIEEKIFLKNINPCDLSIFMIKNLFTKLYCLFYPKNIRNAFVHKRRGVSFLNFKTVYVDENVTISDKNVYIEDGVIIKGTTVIEANVKILKNTVIKDTYVKEGSVIGPFVSIEGAIIGANNKIGPFSFLRPGTETAKNVKVGAFVELKKTSVNENSKIPHLSYIGDAEIGTGVNIGAGVITCNYDGVKKSKTIIGDNVFVGSDSQLIAPVELASNSYIGAGSTINRNVEEYDLAISRVKQVNKKNFVKKK